MSKRIWKFRTRQSSDFFPDLKAGGLVSCVFDSDDKRMKSVYLTDEGSALLKSSRRDAIDVGKEFWKDFSDEEIETLIAILEKLKGNLNND